mmetsp:Transcript_79512/g.257524  ORF Transcript_79512/g.257524 Transcript_79512/m.257524 type:complete len:240 (+) Transcript_79512:386-1105(+)
MNAMCKRKLQIEQESFSTDTTHCEEALTWSRLKRPRNNKLLHDRISRFAHDLLICHVLRRDCYWCNDDPMPGIDERDVVEVVLELVDHGPNLAIMSRVFRGLQQHRRELVAFTWHHKQKSAAGNASDNGQYKMPFVNALGDAHAATVWTSIFSFGTLATSGPSAMDKGLASNVRETSPFAVSLSKTSSWKSRPTRVPNGLSFMAAFRNAALPLWVCRTRVFLITVMAKSESSSFIVTSL